MAFTLRKPGGGSAVRGGDALREDETIMAWVKETPLPPKRPIIEVIAY